MRISNISSRQITLLLDEKSVTDGIKVCMSATLRILKRPRMIFRHATCDASSLKIKESLVEVSCCSNTRSIRDDPYWISTKNSLELIELRSINKFSLV